MRLASTGDMTPKEAIGQLLNYLPIFAFSGGTMTAARRLRRYSTGRRPASARPPWRSGGTRRCWSTSTSTRSPRCSSTRTCWRRSRKSRTSAPSSTTPSRSSRPTKLLKKAKREQGGKLDTEQKKEQSETAKQRKEIREKLQKFLAKIPVFMYVTDFREEALKHVIESASTPALFERVTGLTIEDFNLLNNIGVFNAQHMNAAIYQFKLLRDQQSRIRKRGRARSDATKIGLWIRGPVRRCARFHPRRGLQSKGVKMPLISRAARHEEGECRHRQRWFDLATLSQVIARLTP